MSSLNNYDLILSKRVATNPSPQNFYTSLMRHQNNMNPANFPSMRNRHPNPVSHVIKESSPFMKSMMKKSSNRKSILTNPQFTEILGLRKTNLNDLILKSPEENELKIMNVKFRSHPNHIASEDSLFRLTYQAATNLRHLFQSLGIRENRLSLSERGYALYTQLGTGLLGLVNQSSKHILIEALTFYNGEFTRIMVLVYLGYGCTVWYMAAGGLYGDPLPAVLYPPDASYADFFQVSFEHPLFQK